MSICVCGVLNNYVCQRTKTFYCILYSSLVGPTDRTYELVQFRDGLTGYTFNQHRSF